MIESKIDKPIIIIGAGGHARVILDCLRSLSYTVLGFLAPTEQVFEEGVEYLGTDEHIIEYQSDNILLANGLGSVMSQRERAEVFNRFCERGYKFVSVVHPSAVIGSGVQLGDGGQVMAGAVLQHGVVCGDNTIINTRAGVDHGCIIGSHTHISIGSTLAGNVQVGHHSIIGAGSTIIQGISIGDGCIIAAGAVVTRDVPDGVTVVGVPARRKL